MVASDNAVYAQLTAFLGPKAIVRTARDLGVRSDLPAYFSLGLGAVAVNPLDMARAYATIANDGQRVDGSLMGDRPVVVRDVGFRKSGRRAVNEPQPKPVLTPGEARTLTSILEDVVRVGTGTRAQLAGRAEAGKTGTTDDYGDAWFVGYTPELVVAVWVGYPNELRPMLTEFAGRPVSGGTLPALLWKDFMTRALEGVEPDEFEGAPYLPTEARRVVRRGGRWKLDNGYCPGTVSIVYVAGRAPSDAAECYADEVTVPVVVGDSAAAAQTTLASARLSPDVILIPAPAGKRPGLVVKQEPRGGYLAAGSPVKLFVTHARDGLVPNLVGSSEADARTLLRKLRLESKITYEDGPSGVVLEQSLQPGVAAEPGLRMKLVVGRSSS
jgi:membrane peptidoglycan carboxypeptidase